MADTYDVTFPNAAAFDAAMKAARGSLADLKGPLGVAAAQAITDATASAPRLTGRLAGAHRALPATATRVRVIADTPYAAAIHWGWPAHGIRRRPWIVATWMRNPAPLDKMAGAVQADLDKAAAKT